MWWTVIKEGENFVHHHPPPPPWWIWPLSFIVNWKKDDPPLSFVLFWLHIHKRNEFWKARLQRSDLLPRIGKNVWRISKRDRRTWSRRSVPMIDARTGNGEIGAGGIHARLKERAQERSELKYVYPWYLSSGVCKNEPSHNVIFMTGKTLIRRLVENKATTSDGRAPFKVHCNNNGKWTIFTRGHTCVKLRRRQGEDARRGIRGEDERGGAFIERGRYCCVYNKFLQSGKTVFRTRMNIPDIWQSKEFTATYITHRVFCGKSLITEKLIFRIWASLMPCTGTVETPPPN